MLDATQAHQSDGSGEHIGVAIVGTPTGGMCDKMVPRPDARAAHGPKLFGRRRPHSDPPMLDLGVDCRLERRECLLDVRLVMSS